MCVIGRAIAAFCVKRNAELAQPALGEFFALRQILHHPRSSAVHQNVGGVFVIILHDPPLPADRHKQRALDLALIVCG
jgi:hypothetical protein